MRLSLRISPPVISVNPPALLKPINFVPTALFRKEELKCRCRITCGITDIKKRCWKTRRRPSTKRGSSCSHCRGLNLLSGVVAGFVAERNVVVFVVYLVISLIYLGLGFWCMKKPFPAILTGFIVYVTFIGMNAVADPETLFHGLIWKVIIISGFIYGYKAALQSGKLEKELLDVKKAEDFGPKDEALISGE